MPIIPRIVHCGLNVTATWIVRSDRPTDDGSDLRRPGLSELTHFGQLLIACLEQTVLLDPRVEESFCRVPSQTYSHLYAPMRNYSKQDPDKD